MKFLILTLLIIVTTGCQTALPEQEITVEPILLGVKVGF